MAKEIRIHVIGETDFVEFKYDAEMFQQLVNVTPVLEQGTFVDMPAGPLLNHPNDGRPIFEILSDEETVNLYTGIAAYAVQTETLREALRQDEDGVIAFTCFRSPKYKGSDPIYTIRSLGWHPASSWNGSPDPMSLVMWASFVRAHNEKYWKHSVAQKWLASFEGKAA